MYSLPNELKEYIYDFIYDFTTEKSRVIKELKSVILQQTRTCLCRINRIYFLPPENNIKPSLINGRYKISYSH